MQTKKRFHAKEFLLLALPALLFVIWALFTSEQDVRSNINGRWRDDRGKILEMRVEGENLIVLKNGREDKNYKFRFVSENHIEITDRTRPKTLVYVMEVRLRHGQLRFGNRTDDKSLELFEMVTP
jgi:hypothetical protein